jgi:hypothetical protein
MGVLDPFLERLKSALAFAKEAGRMTVDSAADALWDSVYDDLALSGDSVRHTEKAAPYVLRIAQLYALADKSTTIRVEHLQAALAVWNYCRESARLLFGGSSPEPTPTPDPLWLRLLNAIEQKPGINRTGLREVAGHKTLAPEITTALAYLAGSGLAHQGKCKPEGGGRPAECWYPGRAPGEAGDGVEVDNTTEEEEPGSAPAAGGRELTPDPVADAVAAGDGGRERTNSKAEPERVTLFPPRQTEQTLHVKEKGVGDVVIPEAKPGFL